MAFDGLQSTFSNSLFPSFQQRQASVNMGHRSNGSAGLPFLSSPGVSLQEQDTGSLMPWPHNAHDDPCELNDCAPSGVKTRKPSDKADDGEPDLLGLVSNILGEDDCQDSCYTEGNPPSCNSVWSSRTLREELLKYFQSEAKAQYSSIFLPNYVSVEDFNKAPAESVNQDREEFSQQFSGSTAYQQWCNNLPNGDRDGVISYPQRLPPGLPLPQVGNVSQMQHSKYENISGDKDRADSQPMNSLSEISEFFQPQTEVNSPCFHRYCEDHYIQNSAKPISNELEAPQDINQLVSSFQSFMASEHDSHGEFPNMQRKAVYHEDSLLEQCKITSPAMSAQSPPAMHTQKQLFGEVPRERKGGMRKQTFKHDFYQDLPGFSSQNIEYFQPPKPVSASLNLLNQYPKKLHGENALLFMNTSMNQYSNQQMKQGQIQNMTKPQLQKEKKRMHMSGFVGESFSARPQTANHMREGDKKQPLLHNPYFNPWKSVQRFDGENCMTSSGNIQQFVPLIYPANDPRSYSRPPINSFNFSTGHSFPYGSGSPGMSPGDMLSAKECAAFNSYLGDTLANRGESIYHGMASAMTPSLVMNHGGLVTQLYLCVDECYEQWRCLEKERKKAEVILPKSFLGKRMASVTNTQLPKIPPNATRIDNLIVNLMREQTRVVNLMDRMEGLWNIPLHSNIHTALNRHHMAICNSQARRREELENTSRHQQQRSHFTEERDTLLLVIALTDLAAATRKLRTALWCALQMMVLKPMKMQDQQVDREEATHAESPSPHEGYSFKI